MKLELNLRSNFTVYCEDDQYSAKELTAEQCQERIISSLALSGRLITQTPKLSSWLQKSTVTQFAERNFAQVGHKLTHCTMGGHMQQSHSVAMSMNFALKYFRNRFKLKCQTKTSLSRIKLMCALQAFQEARHTGVRSWLGDSSHSCPCGADNTYMLRSERRQSVEIPTSIKTIWNKF